MSASAKTHTQAQTHPAIVWIDCEMTGLDLFNDTIIEIACVVTDGELNVLEKGKDIVIHQPKSVMDSMNEWCKEHHGRSGLTQSVLESTTTMEQAEQAVLELVKRHCPTPRTAILAGNSVHGDRVFLARCMPRLVEHLHYRIIDVSSVKELAKRWNAKVADGTPKKKMAHRALDDILESIEELRYMQKNFFVLSK
ncbi:rna exonuclease [Coemansia sp. Benny D115]|nr:rna exonuclease [Coemansia sp. Benny D115]